jgi:hypothetical protein
MTATEAFGGGAGLRCEVVDYYEQRKHRAAFNVFPEVRELLEMSDQDAEQGSLNTYREEAAVLGRPFHTIHQKINVTKELPRLRFVGAQHQFAPMLEGTWRLLSGFERPGRVGDASVGG